MKKYIAGFDGLNFSKVNSEYAIKLSKSENAYLTGVFLDDKTYTSYKIYELVIDEGVSEHKLRKLRHNDLELRTNAAKKFQEDCSESSLQFNVHHDQQIAAQELLHETIYADLLFINKNEKFVHHEEKLPSRFLKDILSHSQCPVFITPDNYSYPEKIIFLFDGQPDSVYAFKMFNYLFANFHDLPLEVVMVKRMEDNLHLPDNKLLREFLKRHFKTSVFTILRGIPEEEIINHLQKEKSNFITVLGAYRRTMVSRWFQSSMADALLRNFDMPLMIAHNK